MSSRSDTTQDEYEVVDGEPVLDEHAPVRTTAEPLEPAPEGALARRPPAQVVAQAAAVAVTGFAAGALATAAVRHLKASRRPTRRVVRRDDRDVLASRTFLVDVHLLGSRD